MLAAWSGVVLGVLALDLWQRGQEVVFKVIGWCLSLNYQLAVEGGGTKALQPINGGISFSLNVFFLIPSADRLGSFRYCEDFFSIIREGVGGVMNTLVLAACWASRGCARHMCENPVVFPLYCQEPTDLAWRFDSDLHSNFRTLNSIPEIRRPKKLFHSQSFLGLPPVSRQLKYTCNLCRNCWRSLYYTWLMEIS